VPGFSERHTLEQTGVAISIESVTVPIGTFPDAVVTQERIREWLEGGELPADLLVRKWRVPCLGNVRFEATDLLAGSELSVGELVTTNLVYCPEPAEIALQLSALMTLAVLTRRSRRAIPLGLGLRPTAR